MKRIHFISVLDKQTLSLATSIKKIDFEVSISDENISQTLKEKLKKNNIDFHEGWDLSKINKKIDFIILGSNVKNNNPELIRAKSLDIKIFSFTQFINYFSEEKTRVLVAGTYGKTSLISIILHVLRFHDFPIDFVINKKVSGFESIIQLSKENDFIIIEGNENISSEIDNLSNLHFFNPHLVIITCVFWKYIARYPSFEDYKNYFSLLIDNIIPGGTLIYNENDNEVNNLVIKSNHTIRKEVYHKPKSDIINGIINLQTEEGNYPLINFNDYSLINLGGAIWICQLMGIHLSDFHEAIISYEWS